MPPSVTRLPATEHAPLAPYATGNPGARRGIQRQRRTAERGIGQRIERDALRDLRHAELLRRREGDIRGSERRIAGVRCARHRVVATRKPRRRNGAPEIIGIRPDRPRAPGSRHRKADRFLLQHLGHAAEHARERDTRRRQSRKTRRRAIDLEAAPWSTTEDKPRPPQTRRRSDNCRAQPPRALPPSHCRHSRSCGPQPRLRRRSAPACWRVPRRRTRASL